MKVCLAFSRYSPFKFTPNQLTNPNLKTHGTNPLWSYNYFRVFMCSRQHLLLGVSFLIVYSLSFVPCTASLRESFNLMQSLNQTALGFPI